MPNETNSELVILRTRAKISQSDMATLLGVSQSQISRYEQDPDSVTVGIFNKWKQICGEFAVKAGLEIEDPYIELKDRIKLITDYMTTEPVIPEITNVDMIQNIQEIHSFSEILDKNIQCIVRKPKIGVFGQFDAGKSRLLNTILGGNCLPTGYQPKTSVMTLLRHMNDKPAWMRENVWLMKKGFDFDRVDDEMHCMDHRLIAGGYESLEEYGTHGKNREDAAYSAIVYVDAPFLMAADLLDAPGYGNDDNDHERAEIGKKVADILVYLSTATGFLQRHDVAYLTRLLKTLPVSVAQSPMRNVFIVATQAHLIGSQSDVIDILDSAAMRAYKHLDITLDERSKIFDVIITQENFRSRFFSFSADNSELRVDFENDMVAFIANELPNITRSYLGEQIANAKKAAKGKCEQWVNDLQVALEQREQAQSDYQALIADEERRRLVVTTTKTKVKELINLFIEKANVDVDNIFKKYADVETIESMITERYKDKKEAQQYAATYVVETINQKISDLMLTQAKQLSNGIDSMLADYPSSINVSGEQTGGLAFNSSAAFMGALSGLGTVGALSVWASVAAAGSNLGGYILIAEAIGWLSSLGISLGSSATVMSIVSALGGPVTIAITLGVLVAIGVGSLLGDSWQLKLAKQIYKALEKEKAQTQFTDNQLQYWRQTLCAFDASTVQLEKDYQDFLNVKKTLAYADFTDVQAARKYAMEAQDFFRWYSMESIELTPWLLFKTY